MNKKDKVNKKSNIVCCDKYLRPIFVIFFNSAVIQTVTEC